jgi:hypothetical protein
MRVQPSVPAYPQAVQEAAVPEELLEAVAGVLVGQFRDAPLHTVGDDDGRPDLSLAENAASPAGAVA